MTEIETLGRSTLAMKLLFFSKQLQYDRFEQIRTLRPNATSEGDEFCPLLLIFHPECREADATWLRARLCCSPISG